jgi:hypothetical protein
MERPLTNRVRPDGGVVAHPAQGTLMGNRGGALTDGSGALRRRWASRAWICCVLAFKGRRKDVTGPGYTALFFLDEATALAAGHRPCFECRRAEARAFAVAMAAGLGRREPLRAPEMDCVLHAERLRAGPQVDPLALPPGAMIAADGGFLLVVTGGVRRWAFEGYGPLAPAPPVARLLTPAAALAALAAGYAPRLHSSAFL